ncbi:D-alanine--D-alanine ligase [Candidatus Kuenenbacteria bacterium]|nr:D-alanine--D-alanine ligase [Candidatus Kuenenbacteria bacterium]
MKKINVAVIFGGRSGEHEVSLVSATSVIKNLNKKKYNIIQVGITKDGQWLVGPDTLKYLKTGQGKNFVREAIGPDTLKNKLGKNKIDVVFPVVHGTFGEDGTLQGLMELADVPYVGAGVLSSAVCMDKIMQKILCGAEKILVPDWIWFSKSEWSLIKGNKIYFKKWAEGIEKRLGYPMFVKPSNSGSSVGISKAHDRGELVKAIHEAVKYDRRILVEKGIEGAMEIEVAVLGNEKPEASTPGQVIPSNEFYDYDAKYVDGKSKSLIPAPLPKEVIKKIQDIAIESFRLLDGAGMARVDFLVKKETMGWKIYLNELNTIPGFTSISMYPKMWEASGAVFGKLLEALIILARRRYDEKKKLQTSYKTKKAWYK